MYKPDKVDICFYSKLTTCIIAGQLNAFKWIHRFKIPFYVFIYKLFILNLFNML